MSSAARPFGFRTNAYLRHEDWAFGYVRKAWLCRKLPCMMSSIPVHALDLYIAVVSCCSSPKLESSVHCRGIGRKGSHSCEGNTHCVTQHVGLKSGPRGTRLLRERGVTWGQHFGALLAALLLGPQQEFCPFQISSYATNRSPSYLQCLWWRPS